ncbi:MAG: hypothetical protein M0R39_13975 [Prolixibacteraceae bacterium]|nr:hypothetical protein [Prolixibacteraceae bacterium]
MYNLGHSIKNADDYQEISPVIIGNWDNKSFSIEWQEFTIDLTPYFIEKVGQFELKFQSISHDFAFNKHGEHGLEYKDWKVEMHGTTNPDVILKG